MRALVAGRGLDKADAGGGGGGGGRRRRGGKDEGSGAIDEVVGQRAGASNVTTRCAKALAKGAHLNFDAVAHAEFLRQSAVVCAVKASGVGLIHHEPGAVFLLELHDLTQRSVITIHGEDAFRDDEDACSVFRVACSASRKASSPW